MKSLGKIIVIMCLIVTLFGCGERKGPAEADGPKITAIETNVIIKVGDEFDPLANCEYDKNLSVTVDTDLKVDKAGSYKVFVTVTNDKGEEAVCSYGVLVKAGN